MSGSPHDTREARIATATHVLGEGGYKQFVKPWVDELNRATRAEAEAVTLREALRDADREASAAHDAIYAEPFDQKAASSAIWRIHNLLRPLAAGSRVEGE